MGVEDDERRRVIRTYMYVYLYACMHASINRSPPWTYLRDEDDDLVELERVEELVELAVLLVRRQLDVELLEPVQRQLCLVVHKDLQRLSYVYVCIGRFRSVRGMMVHPSNPPTYPSTHRQHHTTDGMQARTHRLAELAADGADLLGEGGREHHDLLLVGRGAEDLLDVPPHVCGEGRGGVSWGWWGWRHAVHPVCDGRRTELLEELVALVQHEALHVVQLQRLLAHLLGAVDDGVDWGQSVSQSCQSGQSSVEPHSHSQIEYNAPARGRGQACRR